MTIDEKRKYVEGFCFTQNHCDLCPCIDLCDTSPRLINCMTEEELDGMIEAIKNAKQPNDEVEQELHECEDYDVVERPQHYIYTSIECIDAMTETQGVEAVKSFCICNAFKYLWRHNGKNGDEDIRKASWYLNKAVELMGDKHEN